MIEYDVQSNTNGRVPFPVGSGITNKTTCQIILSNPILFANGEIFNTQISIVFALILKYDHLQMFIR
jgi:hypothetical protein